MSNTYLNSRPILKTCENCAYRRVNSFEWEHCRRYGWSCMMSRTSEKLCGPEFKGWQPIPPKPPRRSLRRWLIDLLWT